MRYPTKLAASANQLFAVKEVDRAGFIRSCNQPWNAPWWTSWTALTWAAAEATEFRPEVLEKNIHLLNLLEALRSHPFLKDRLVPGAGRHPPYSTAPNADEAMTRLLSPDSDIHPLFCS